MGIDVSTRCILGWAITYKDLLSFVQSWDGRSCDPTDGKDDLCDCGPDCWFRDVPNPFPDGIGIEYSDTGVEDVPYGNCDHYLIVASAEEAGLDEMQSKVSAELVEKGYQLFMKIKDHHKRMTRADKKPKLYGIVHIC